MSDNIDALREDAERWLDTVITTELYTSVYNKVLSHAINFSLEHPEVIKSIYVSNVTQYGFWEFSRSIDEQVTREFEIYIVATESPAAWIEFVYNKIERIVSDLSEVLWNQYSQPN